MSLNNQRSPWRDARRWLPGVLISAVLIFFLANLANWQDLIHAFESITLTNVLAAMLISAASLIIRAAAWRILLEGKPTLQQSFFIINIGYMLNNLFPLRAGEIGRAVFMGQAVKVSPFHVLSTIVIERAFDMAVAAGLLLITLPMALGLDWARPVGTITLILVAAAMFVMFLMARYSEAVHRLAARLGARWGWVKRYVIPQVDSLLDGLSALRNPRTFLLSVFWIVLTWVFWIAVYYVTLITIAPAAPLWWAIFADAVLALGVAIPSAPAALGVYEGSMVAALVILGINRSEALAYAIVMHFIQFALTGVLGLWGLARQRKSLSSIFSEIRLEQPAQRE